MAIKLKLQFSDRQKNYSSQDFLLFGDSTKVLTFLSRGVNSGAEFKKENLQALDSSTALLLYK